MAVRKIPKNHLFVTGGYSSRKSEDMDAFESLLEKDYLLLLDFDDTVESFDVQPVRIPVAGVAKGYVPDVLVKYRPDIETGENRKPLLAEVKRSDYLEKHIAKYAPKFAAAVAYAENMGWEFRPVDETEIRLPRLRNIKFLREYRNVSPSAEDCRRVVQTMMHHGRNSSSERVLAEIAPSDDERLYWLPVLWSMVLQKRLLTDLNIPFGGDVKLSIQATGSMETRPMSAAEAPDIRSARSICSFRVLGSRIALEKSDSRFSGGRNSFDNRLLDEPK